VTYPDGDANTTNNEVVTTAYNGMGLPSKLTTNQGKWNGSSWAVGTLVDGPLVNGSNQADYDDAGRLRQIRLPTGTPATTDDLWRALN
jgi:hypothetical protein